MEAPLISICIPVYNGERYLRECLDSCLAQTFRQFEIVICDDGSTDGSVAIIEEYGRRHSFIRIYKNDRNLGLVGNWNKCLQHANGAWIKFLFQDDAMTDNCMQRFYDHIHLGHDLLVCRRYFVLDKAVTGQEKDYYENQVRTLENTGHYRGNAFSPAVISRIAAGNISMNFIAEPSLTLFKKSLLDKTGMFDDALKQICDLEFFLRAASSYGLYYIPEQLCRFRIHAHSTTEKNIGGKNYRLLYLEALLFAIKLLVKPQFSAFRQAITPLQRFKLKLYVKYKSYIAFRAVRSADDTQMYRQTEEVYGRLLFKPYERPYLRLMAWLRSQ